MELDDLIGLICDGLRTTRWIPLIDVCQEWCMVLVLTGLVLRLGTVGRDGHTSGTMGFIAGYIYSTCLFDV